KGHYGNPSSIHADGRQSRTAIEKARRRIAHSIGASIGEIFFTSGGTEANNMALKCSVRDLGVKRIISCPTEHHCILHTLDALVKYEGIDVVYLDVDKKGCIRESDLREAIAASDEKTLVSLMHANNEIGTLHDFEKIAAICEEANVFFHSDTVQAIGQFPIDVSKTNISFLAGAAHKFHGPKGVGFIYINGNNIIHPYIDGGAQERNMRGGTENLYGIVGMAEALQISCAKMEERRTYIDGLRNYMKEQLVANFEKVVFNGCPDKYLHKVLSVSFAPSANGEMLLMLLDMAGISASGGSACSSGVEHESHVLAAIDGHIDYKTARFSFSHHNTKEEIDIVVAKLMELLK
ncbi:MAG: cysteine desulfurase, partial [Maribacter sp.]